MKISKAAAIVDDMKSDDDIYADKADKEVAEKRPRSLWYYCCDHYCVSCTSKRYYWEKGWLLIMKNVGARDFSVRLFMSSNLFLETVVCYLFKLVGVVVFEYICGEWRRIDFNRIETFKISTILHLNDTRSTSSCPKMNWKLFMCQDHLVYIYGL